jgi:hypothetical protein
MLEEPTGAQIISGPMTAAETHLTATARFHLIPGVSVEDDDNDERDLAALCICPADYARPTA